VRLAFPSWNRSILTEIYLCHACSHHEIEDGNARTGVNGLQRAAGGAFRGHLGELEAEEVRRRRRRRRRRCAAMLSSHRHLPARWPLRPCYAACACPS
jgi:hypothetical protein